MKRSGKRHQPRPLLHSAMLLPPVKRHPKSSRGEKEKNGARMPHDLSSACYRKHRPALPPHRHPRCFSPALYAPLPLEKRRTMRGKRERRKSPKKTGGKNRLPASSSVMSLFLSPFLYEYLFTPFHRTGNDDGTSGGADSSRLRFPGFQ